MDWISFIQTTVFLIIGLSIGYTIGKYKWYHVGKDEGYQKGMTVKMFRDVEDLANKDLLEREKEKEHAG